MPLFKWKCKKCGEETKKLLPSRPELGKCHCGSEQEFQTGMSAMVMESLDNGVMVRKVERLSNAEELTKERSLTERPKDDTIV